MPLTRKGECNGCGFCCQVISRVHLLFQTDDAAFLKVRGMQPDGTKWIDIVDPCPQHVDNSCAIYDTRPKTCRDFPQKPEEIRDTPCSYWFEDEEGNRVT
jgi:Fe-S-cluster containining protein